MYKAAVIGLGQMGLMYDLELKREKPSSHALAYFLNPVIELVAAADVRPEQKGLLQQVVPDALFYTDIVEMFKRHPVDIVSICTPPTGRLQLLKSVLEMANPRVIFCEKPVAGNTNEAEQIIDLLKSRGSLLIPNLSRRWNTGILEIHETIKKQQYGPLRKIHLRYTRGIYNTGSHIFDLVRFFAGGIQQVQVTEQVPTSSDLGGEPSFSFTFTAGNSYANESSSDRQVSGYAEAFDDRHYYMFEMDLYFEQGKIEIRQSGDEIKYYSIDDHPLFGGFQSLHLNRHEEGLLKKSNNLQNAVEHIVDIIENGVEPLCTIEDGVYPLYVAEALIRSHGNNGSSEKVVTKHE